MNRSALTVFPIVKVSQRANFAKCTYVVVRAGSDGGPFSPPSAPLNFLSPIAKNMRLKRVQKRDLLLVYAPLLYHPFFDNLQSGDGNQARGSRFGQILGHTFLEGKPTL